MAKLHKSSAPKTRHGRGSNTKNVPAQLPVRLSPAEIRMQNNPAAAVTQPLQSHMVAAVMAPPDKRASGTTTPPKSPRKRHTVDGYQADVARTSSQRLPTPPQSPVLYYSRTNPVQKPSSHHAHLRHRVSTQADILVARELVSSRPNSSNSSRNSAPYGAPAFYRGNEVTRNGSISLYNRPQPQIVGNVLSNFSRPRNGHSPPGSVRRQSSVVESERMLSVTDTPKRASTTPDLSAVSSMHSMRPPAMRAESLPSLESRASRHFTILHEDSLPLPAVQTHAKADLAVEGEDPVVAVKEVPKRELGIRPKHDAVGETKREPIEEPEKMPKSAKRKSTLSLVLDPARVFKHNIKLKRHTLPAASAPVPETGEPKRQDSGPEGETAKEVVLPPPTKATPIGFAAQPAARPVSMSPTSEITNKGKGQVRDVIHEETGLPVCACCGKVRKPKSRPLDSRGSEAATGANGAAINHSAHGSVGSNMTSPVTGDLVESPTSARAESPALSRSSERRRSSQMALRAGDTTSVLPGASPKRQSKPPMVKFAFPENEAVPEAVPRVTRFPSLLGNTHRPDAETLRKNGGQSEPSDLNQTAEAAAYPLSRSPTSQPTPTSVLTPVSIISPTTIEAETPPSPEAQVASSIYSQVTLPSPHRNLAKIQPRPLSFDSRRESILFNNGEEPRIVVSPDPPSPLTPPTQPANPQAASQLLAPLSLPEPDLGLHFAQSHLPLHE